MIADTKNASSDLHWFAMRVTYRREMAVKDMLDAEQVESFVPMHKVVRQQGGRKHWMMEPVVHNLLFVHSSKEWLQQFKARVPHLQYMTMRDGEKTVPIVVPEDQMQRFMEVSKTYDEQLLFLDPNGLDLARGTRVRIHGGVFDGMEGIFMKVAGKRNRRVVIAIKNVIAVALAYVAPDFIEVIE